MADDARPCAGVPAPDGPHAALVQAGRTNPTCLTPRRS